MTDLFDIHIILKIGFLILDVFYIIFLFVVLNRVSSMSKIIREIHDAIILKFVAVIKVLFAISLFLLGLAIL